MSWIFFALLSPGIDAITNFIDKYIVAHELPDYLALPVYTSIIGFIAGIIFWIITGFPILSLLDTALILSTGVLQVWALATYFKALSSEDTSKLIIFFKITPIFILILSYIFLKESLSTKQIIGFFIIFISIISLSFKNTQKKTRISQSFLLILLTDFFWASAAILAKFTITSNSLSKVLSYESWGISLGGIFLYIFFPSIRKAFHKSLHYVRKQAFIALVLNECLFILSKTIIFAAYSLGNVALVSILGGTQVYYGIILGIVLTKIFPTIFHENISWQNIKTKLLSATALIVGIIFIS